MIRNFNLIQKTSFQYFLVKSSWCYVQFCLIKNHKSENTTHCTLSLVIWNKLRAFQNEGQVQRGKNVTGKMVSVEGAVGCLEVLEEQYVMCSLVSLPHKGSVGEPWILRPAWWAGSLDVLLGNKSMIACSDSYYVKTTILCVGDFELIFSVEVYGHDTVSHEFTEVQSPSIGCWDLWLALYVLKRTVIIFKKRVVYSQIIQIGWLITEDYLDIFSITVGRKGVDLSSWENC